MKEKDTRSRLLDAALGQIWKSSYTGAGIAQICDEAGTTKGSFYHFFDSKSDLAIAALEEHWVHARSDFDSVFAPHLSPSEQISAFCKHTIKSQTSHRQKDGYVVGCPFFATGMECGALDTSVQKAVDRVIELELAYFFRLAREIGAPRFPDDQAVTDGGKAMFAFLQGILAMARVKDDMELIENALEPGLRRLAGL